LKRITGPFPCTLATAVLIAATIGGGGYLLDDHGLPAYLRRRTELKLQTKYVPNPPRGVHLPIADRLAEMERTAAVKFHVDWSTFSGEYQPHMFGTITVGGEVREAVAYMLGLVQVDGMIVNFDPYRRIDIDRWGRVRITGTAPPTIERDYDYTPWVGRFPISVAEFELRLKAASGHEVTELFNHQNAGDALRSYWASRVAHDVSPEKQRLPLGHDSYSLEYGILRFRATPEQHHHFEREFQRTYPDTKTWLERVWTE
jgi:hypothetical protein